MNSDVEALIAFATAAEPIRLTVITSMMFGEKDISLTFSSKVDS